MAVQYGDRLDSTAVIFFSYLVSLFFVPFPRCSHFRGDRYDYLCSWRQIRVFVSCRIFCFLFLLALFLLAELFADSVSSGLALAMTRNFDYFWVRRLQPTLETPRCGLASERAPNSLLSRSVAASA